MIKLFLKKCMFVLFIMFAASCILGIKTQASVDEPVVSAEVIELGTTSLETYFGISFFDVDNGIVDLKDGTYEQWIDRIDAPDYAIHFYNTLVEYTDNDGNDDLLISDDGFSEKNATSIDYGIYGTDRFQGIEIVTLENPTESEIEYVYGMIRAIFDTFIMDHPEVFWFDGATSCYRIQYNYPAEKKVRDTFYFLIKMHDGSYSYPFDLRAENYQSESAITADILARDNAVNTILNSSSVEDATNDYEIVKALNKWLTKNNEYNTLVSSGSDKFGPDSAHNCLSALTGNSGVTGPVCEGYAKAFKVLCDIKEIPCVLVTGNAYVSNTSSPEAHAWNYTKIDDSWYAMDITWNDPAVYGISKADSGYENENYLLVGSATIHNDMKFIDSHVPTNCISSNGISFSNGPLLSTDKYEYTENENGNIPDVVVPEQKEVVRIFGSDRYETSLRIADTFKEKLDLYKFNTVIISSGKKFADALAGSYLASRVNAPILMTNGKNIDSLCEYIKENLNPNGTIYLLGGDEAVPKTVEFAVNSLGTVKRLEGIDRYGTNLEILKEAGVENEDIIVCTGKTFADSLSASAAKNPILLVNSSLSEAQKEFLAQHSENRIYIVGGEDAVNPEIETELRKYNFIERIYGETRYETSTLFAQKFFDNATQAVLAYAKNFPDGLCGGVLATAIDAPLILTATDENAVIPKETEAIAYMRKNGISSGIVLGGDSLITDDSTKMIFALDSDAKIII